MKKLLLILLSITTIGAAFPAFAGPDWQLIAQGRKAKTAQLAQTTTSKEQKAGMNQTANAKPLKAHDLNQQKNVNGIGDLYSGH